MGHKARAHALLSASAAERWMHCPPSALLADKYPQTTSTYAAEGTRAHEIAEQCLRAFLNNQKEPDYTNNDLEIRQELDSYIDSVIETYNAEKAIHPDTLMFLESRVDFSQYVPEGFGTADVIIMAGSRMYVIDLKFGKGVEVNAEGNPQLRLYGLGAYLLFSDIYDITHITLEIRQPRKDHFSADFLPVEDLLEWGKKEVLPSAKKAFKGEGEFNSGAWCRFCPIKNCKHRAETMQKMVSENYDPAVLSNEDVGEVLKKAEQLTTWLDALKSYATDQILQGNIIPGWKLVEGKTNRKYVNEDTVATTLRSNKYKDAIIFEKKLLGITAMEKALGKKVFKELLGDLIVKPTGAPTLALESDKRNPFNPQQQILNDMQIEEE